MDPLSVLKDFNTTGRLQQVDILNNNVQFGDRYTFPAATPVYKTGAAGGPAYYTLHDVLFYLKNRNLKAHEYVMAVNQAGVSNILIQDRKRLLDVLDGHAELDPALVPVGITYMGPADGDEPQAKRMRMDADEAAASRSLKDHERQLRNRNTMLLAPNKDFKRVLDIVNSLKKSLAKAPPAHTSSHRPASSSQPASSHGHSRADDGGSRPGQGGYVVARSSAKPEAGKGAPPAAGAKGAPAKGAPPAAPPAAKGAAPAPGKDKPGGVPIIIVPAGMTAMLNMYNAVGFLERGEFVPPQKAMAAAAGTAKPAVLSFKRSAHRATPVAYEVTDRAPAAKSPDWDRVVAVVVQGTKWQFKDWPEKGAKEGELKETFNKVCGFYMHYADEKVGPAVADWNVKRLALHRESRHKDMTVMLDLFKHLDVFLAAKRSGLNY